MRENVRATTNALLLDRWEQERERVRQEDEKSLAQIRERQAQKELDIEMIWTIFLLVLLIAAIGVALMVPHGK